jgi:predicted dehydrogenase
VAYRGALIGFGGVARQAHLPGFQHDAATRSRFEIVAAVDPIAAASPVAAEVPFPIVADRSALCDMGPIDFVDICTPTASHARLTLWALERGYHVLCEKPVALTARESEAIATAARVAGRTVMPCHQYRFNPAWRQMRQWLDGGAIGHWHLAELSVYRAAADAGAAADAASVPWRGTSGDGAGGILLDHGTHLLYTLRDLAGPPLAVRAWTARLRHLAYDVEDTAQIVLEYPDRVAVVFLTWAARARENRVRFIGDRGTIEWIGGELRLDANGQRETRDMSATLDKGSYAEWFAALFQTFADAMHRGATAEEPLSDIAQVAQLLEAAYTAARTGSRVAL